MKTENRDVTTVDIDSEKCTGCGICGDVCPRHILETVLQDNVPTTSISSERRHLCLGCGQCLAVCPQDAIGMDGVAPNDVRPVRPLAVKAEDLLTLLAQRRSVRRYKDKPVPRETLARIVDAARRAPTGAGSASTGVLVIDTAAALDTLSSMLHEVYDNLATALKNPMARFVIKRRIGYVMLHTLRNFVMPGMQWFLHWKREEQRDEILRGCKALILFHSPILEPMAEANCTIAAFHGILMAEVLGVGTCLNHLIPLACNPSRKIRDYLGLPDDREFYSSLTIGFPKYKYHRVVPKQFDEVRYLGETK